MRVPGNQDLSRRLITHSLENTNVSCVEEWKFDHGIMVPLHHLTLNFSLPIIPANTNCQALRVTFDAMSERIALINTGEHPIGPVRRTAKISTPRGARDFSTTGLKIIWLQ
jgi:aromatic ring-opening dioxygenase catalytic subunit (LigB family)